MNMIAASFAHNVAQPGAGFVSPRRIADILHLGMAELATMVGASRATLAKQPVTPAAERALSPLVRILAMAAEMAGSMERASLWFKHQPLPGWGGRTAHDLVGAGEAQAVLDYLEASRAGVYA
jgi:uncharacterized protein (DUF2384 family)